MIAVVQRVTRASVEVDGAIVGAIDGGLCVLVGIERGDSESLARRLASKLVRLRILPDADGKMNRSVLDAGDAVLLVSQFTLAADTSHGNRPSFVGAAPPDEARVLFEAVVAEVAAAGVRVATGRFQEHMSVRIENDGPVTIILRP